MYRLLVGVTVIPGEQPVFIFRGSSPLSCTSNQLPSACSLPTVLPLSSFLQAVTMLQKRANGRHKTQFALKEQPAETSGSSPILRHRSGLQQVPLVT